jgi:hypothetical protein
MLCSEAQLIKHLYKNGRKEKKMRKIITIAAIALTCAVNAASFSWGFSSDSIVGPDGYNVEGYLDGGKAFLYIGDTLIAEATQNPSTYKFGIFDNTASDTSGKVQTLADGAIDFVGQAYKLVLQTTDGKYEIVYNGTSSYSSVAGAAGEDNKNFEQFIVSTAYQTKDWQAVAVPEPTSGLLLLLGMAGLALRRKQA